MSKITLKAARVNAGLTQDEVAKKIGVAITTIRNWESGKTYPQIPQFMQLCELYDTPSDHIFFKN